MPTPDQYIIQKTTMDGIANAVRGMRYEKGAMTPAQIEDKIRNTEIGIPISISCNINPETGKWERPSDWPNLDSIEMANNFEGAYLTYDLRKTPDYGWIGISCNFSSSSGSGYIERGHLEDGAFVADAQYILSHSTPFRQALDSTYGDVQLWRVYSSTHGIQRFYFRTNTGTSAQNYYQNLQPCVEITGQFKNLTALISDDSSTGSSSASWATQWMERDSRRCSGSSVTSLGGAWRSAYSLQSLDFSKWDTSDWAVTSLANAFESCRSLIEIDFSGWDTSNWAVTTLGACFNSCYSLKGLDLNCWDVSNWPVSGLNYFLNNCHSLRFIHFSQWDTSDWAVTTLGGCFYGCRSLQSLSELESWDVSNWRVTELCRNNRGVFQNCTSIKELDLSDWDVSEWRPPSTYMMFSGCISLIALDLSQWDVSDWPVTQIYNMFDSCWSLQEIKGIDKWDTSNWTVTSIASSGVYGPFNECYSLKKIDISRWDCQNFNISQANTIANNCYALETYLLPEDFGYDSTSTNQMNQQPNLPNLVNFSGVRQYVNTNLQNCVKLSHQSLVNVIARLPAVSASRTLTLGQTNKLKLTAEEIAVATQKGWTVA